MAPTIHHLPEALLHKSVIFLRDWTTVIGADFHISPNNRLLTLTFTLTLTCGAGQPHTMTDSISTLLIVCVYPENFNYFWTERGIENVVFHKEKEVSTCIKGSKWLFTFENVSLPSLALDVKNVAVARNWKHVYDNATRQRFLKWHS